MEVLIYGGYRIRDFRGRHGSWRILHHHRVGGVTTSAAYVELWVHFGTLSMEAILVC